MRCALLVLLAALPLSAQTYPTQAFPGTASVPLSGGTMTGSLVGTTISAQQLGSTYQVAQFAGAGPREKIAACFAALKVLGGGECDATGLASATPVTITDEIKWGDTTTATAIGQYVLHLPSLMDWKFNIVDATYAKCGIRQYGNTIIRADTVGGGGNWAQIEPFDSTTKMNSLYCTDKSDTSHPAYIKFSGLKMTNHTSGATFQNNSGTGFTTAIMDVGNIADESSFDYFIADNWFGDAGHVSDMCCGAGFHHGHFYASQGAQGLGSYAGGGTPLTLDAYVSGTTALAFEDVTVNAPGTGKPNVHITAASGSVTFENLYGEGNCAADLTTPMVQVDSGAVSVVVVGGAMNPFCTNLANSANKPLFQTGTISGFTEIGVATFQASLGVKDTTNGNTVAVSNGTVPSYFSGQGHPSIVGLSEPSVFLYPNGYGAGSSSAPVAAIAGSLSGAGEAHAASIDSIVSAGGTDTLVTEGGALLLSTLGFASSPASGTNYHAKLKFPSTATANYTFSLPTALPASTLFLQVDNTGQMSYGSSSTGGAASGDLCGTYPSPTVCGFHAGVGSFGNVDGSAVSGGLSSSGTATFYQGPGGTAGHSGAIHADYNILYLSNPDGAVQVDSASDASHPFRLQVGGNSMGSWVTSTGGWTNSTGDLNLLPSAGKAVNVRNNGSGLVVASIAETGAAVFTTVGSTAYTTASLGGSALAAGACSTIAVTITGLPVGSLVSASPQTYPGAGFVWSAYYSGTDTATVQVCAIVAGTPTASLYNVRVTQ